MAGVFTDNQPDFSFLQPYETRTFSQCWYPIRAIGAAHEANRDAAVSLAVDGNRARVGVAVTRPLPGARITVSSAVAALVDRRVDLAPDEPFTTDMPLRGGEAGDLDLRVTGADGTLVTAYRPRRIRARRATATGDRAATARRDRRRSRSCSWSAATWTSTATPRAPEAYWREGVRREPGDSRCNTALGAWHLRRGELADAERHLRRAIATLTARNPNPAEGEPFYLLGVTLRMADRLDEAEDAFGKAAWNGGWQAAAETARATVRSRLGDLDGALEAVERALASDARNTWARVFCAALLRRAGRTDRALETIDAVLGDDPLDAWALHERDLLASGTPDVPLPGGVQVHLDVAHDYAIAGLDQEALEVLARAEAAGAVNPLVPYTMAWLEARRGNDDAARGHAARGRATSTDYCFPARLEEIGVLETAVLLDPSDPRAPYYLGNLLYDRRRYDDAIRAWRRAAANDPGFSIVQRNLGIAEYNVRRRPVAARAAYVRARRAAPDDARLLYEFDQLRKRLGEDPAARLAALDQEPGLVGHRDDLTVERVTLLNQLGRHDDALEVSGPAASTPGKAERASCRANG